MSKMRADQEGTEDEVQRAARFALIMSFSILGVAVAYFGALYLITR